MGFYSFGRVKIVSRGKGKSSVATAAYNAGTEYTNQYDGVTHDFTRKQYIGETYIRMPESSPASWMDESIPAKERLGKIWNTVELATTADNARLARANYIALPHNLPLGEALACVDEWIKRECTSRGMGVTYTLHDKPNNRHVDVMYLVREYGEDGKAKAKSKKEYLCRNNAGEERYMDGEELRDAGGSWEKIYKYRNQRNGAVVQMTPSEMAADGDEWVRVNKYAVCRTVTVGAWDNDWDLTKKWRKSWEEVVNAKFKELGIDDSVDSRSHAERGLATLPTKHEGWGPEQAENREYNAQVRRLNQELDELKQEAIDHTVAIAGIVNSLQFEPQTPTSLDEREREYKHHEKMLHMLEKSELLPADRPSIIRNALKKLGEAFSRLLKAWQGRFVGKSLKPVQEAVQEAQEATRAVQRGFNSILGDAYTRSEETGKSPSKISRDFDKE